MSKHSRKQLFVDPKVQGALAVRAVFYWIVCLIAMALMILCWRIVVSGPARVFYRHFDDMWYFYGPAVIASFVLLPVVVMDIIRVSNRFAGPMLRLRRGMRALARGERVEPIRFRQKDFWCEFAEEFNAVANRVQGVATTDAAASEPAATDAVPHESAAEQPQ